MLKNIRARNLQALKHVDLEDLPKSGIIGLFGPNGEGKSTLERALSAVISGSMGERETRQSLISWTESWGELILERYDGAILTAHFALEISECFVRYQDDKYVDTRSPKDDYSDIISYFGLHYDKQRGVSLNVYRTFDPLLFISTSPATNASMFEVCLTDPVVLKSLEAHKSFKKGVDDRLMTLRASESSLRSQLLGLTIYDLNYEETYHKRFVYLHCQIQYCMDAIIKVPGLEERCIMPSVPREDILAMSRTLIAVPDIVEVTPAPEVDLEYIRLLMSLSTIFAPNLPDTESAPEVPSWFAPLRQSYYAEIPRDIMNIGIQWDESIKERKLIEQKTCPTCGRRLVDHDASTNSLHH